MRPANADHPGPGPGQPLRPAERSGDAPTPGPRGLLLAVTVVYILTASGLDIFNPALPGIQRVFGASVHDMSLVLNAYFIGFSVLSVAMGVVGDRHDKRTAILACLSLFCAGSVLTLLPWFPALVAGRLLQGIGASGPVVLSLVVLLENHPPERHAALVGKVSAVVAIATCLAPVAGAAVTAWAGWRGSFVLLLVAGLWATSLVWTRMPPSPGDAGVRLSVASYARLFRADWLPGAFIVALLRANYLAFLGFSAMYYVNELGVSVIAMGFHLGTLALAFSLSSLLAPRVSRRFGETRCVRASLWATVAVAAAMLAHVLVSGPDPVVVTAGMAAISALVVLPNNILYPKVLTRVPGMRGRAAALVHAFKMVFSAALVLVFAAAYEHGIAWIAMVLGAAYAACAFVFERLLRASRPAPARDAPGAGAPPPMSFHRSAGTEDARHP